MSPVTILKTSKKELIREVSKFFTFITGAKMYSINTLNDLHNKYSGKRCFVIGNGPSLNSHDLDLIKNEYSFAANRIYKIFDVAEWRPTFYCVFDESVIADKDVIDNSEKISCLKFTREQVYFSAKRHKGNFCYINTWSSRSLLDAPQFSEDLTKGIYGIANVTYCTIQIARWMGFSEIILLGMDNRYAYSRERDGTIRENKGVISYFSDNHLTLPDPQNAAATWEMDVAYEYAEKYSKKHGFRILNATRGGFLEKFERVDLETIMEEKKGTKELQV